jgi:Abortive infection alpha
MKGILMENDLIGLGKIADSIEKGTKEFRQLTYDFLAPPVKEAGQLIADKIKFYRVSNTIKAMKEATEMIKAAKIQQNSVTLKIFMPLIEACSLEDDNDMVSKWAGLLASAASGGMVLPSFIRILSDLSSDEARIIELIYLHRLNSPMIRNTGVDKGELKTAIGLPDEEYGVRILNLLRLNIIEQLTIAPDYKPGYGDWSEGGHVGLTALGEAFITACKGPSAKIKA